MKRQHHPHVQFPEALRASWQQAPPKKHPHSCQPAACGGSVLFPPLLPRAATQRADAARSPRRLVPQLRLRSLLPRSRKHAQPAFRAQVAPIQPPTPPVLCQDNNEWLPRRTHSYYTGSNTTIRSYQHRKEAHNFKAHNLWTPNKGCAVPGIFTKRQPCNTMVTVVLL